MAAILSEGALAEVAEGMALCSRAERHFDLLEARLSECRVKIDRKSFENIRYHLDKLHAQLTPLPLLSADAAASHD